MDRLLRGEIPPGGKCDIKTLAVEAAADRTAFYGTRPYSYPRVEFERRLQALQQAGDLPDPREAQITRLKTENAKLRERLDRPKQTIDELTDFRTQALARLAAQHEEIVRLREAAAGNQPGESSPFTADHGDRNLQLKDDPRSVRRQARGGDRGA